MLALITFFFAVLGCSSPAVQESPNKKDLLPPKLNDARIQFRPGVDFVPENGVTLRIHFPEAIQLNGQSIRITDLEGERIDGAMSRWVWDEPRRVVRLEPAMLKAGTRFAVVAEGLVTDGGEALPAFSKTLIVRDTDTTPPNGGRITVEGTAKANTSEPLTLVFDEPVRWSSLGALAVLAGSEAVQGDWTLGPHQTRAVFQPAQAWGDAPTFISVGAGVSDLAGNQLVELPTGMLRPRTP